MSGGTSSRMAWFTAGVTVEVAVGESEPVAEVVTDTEAEAEGEAVAEGEREAAAEAEGETEVVAEGEGVLALQRVAPEDEYV